MYSVFKSSVSLFVFYLFSPVLNMGIKSPNIVVELCISSFNSVNLWALFLCVYMFIMFLLRLTKQCITSCWNKMSLRLILWFKKKFVAVVQSLSCVRLFGTLWTPAPQAPGKCTGTDCHFLLQIFLTQGLNSYLQVSCTAGGFLTAELFCQSPKTY